MIAGFSELKWVKTNTTTECPSVDFPPGVEFAEKGWRLGAKANTSQPLNFFSPSPLHLLGEVSSNAQRRAGILILNV